MVVLLVTIYYFSLAKNKSVQPLNPKHHSVVEPDQTRDRCQKIQPNLTQPNRTQPMDGPESSKPCPSPLHSIRRF